MKGRISRTAARACLAEIQRIADAARVGHKGRESELAHEVLMRLIGSLEAHVPSVEWNRVDVFRRWSAEPRADAKVKP